MLVMCQALLPVLHTTDLSDCHNPKTDSITYLCFTDEETEAERAPILKRQSMHLNLSSYSLKAAHHQAKQNSKAIKAGSPRSEDSYSSYNALGGYCMAETSTRSFT